MKFPWYELVVEESILRSLNGSSDNGIRGSCIQCNKRIRCRIGRKAFLSYRLSARELSATG